jgi:uncharacterized protein YndB with AHSA1/START domain
MAAGNSTAVALTTPTDLEVVATREFNAPRELVFRTYTDPALVARWWSPKRHTTVVDKMDVRVGGAWRYIVQDAATGVEIVAFSGEYREIVPPGRIVRTENFEPVGPGHECIDTVVFEEIEGGRTRMTETMVFKAKEDRDMMLQSGMESGFNESLQTLDQLLEELKAA